MTRHHAPTTTPARHPTIGSTIGSTIASAIATRRRIAVDHPDRGLELLEWALMAGGFIVIIAGLLFLVNGSLTDWWNSLNFGNVLP